MLRDGRARAEAGPRSAKKGAKNQNTARIRSDVIQAYDQPKTDFANFYNVVFDPHCPFKINDAVFC